MGSKERSRAARNCGGLLLHEEHFWQDGGRGQVVAWGCPRRASSLPPMLERRSHSGECATVSGTWGFPPALSLLNGPIHGLVNRRRLSKANSPRFAHLAHGAHGTSLQGCGDGEVAWRAALGKGWREPLRDGKGWSMGHYGMGMALGPPILLHRWDAKMHGYSPLTIEAIIESNSAIGLQRSLAGGPYGKHKEVRLLPW